MREWLARIRSKPQIAHVERALGRFNERLGSQFAAAITYFSVLAVVPVLMFAFSILGFVLVELRPDLIDSVVSSVSEAVGGVDPATKQKFVGVIDNALRNYWAVGIFGLLSAAYSGAGWINNLRRAVRAQWRTSFDEAEPKQNFVVMTLKNFVVLIGLIVAVAATFAVATAATSLTSYLLGLIGMDTVGWVVWLSRLAPILVSFGTGWLLFMYLYSVLPSNRMPWTAVRRGAVIGSLGLGILEYLTSFLIGSFAGNLAASIFGPIIAVMLFFNLFSMLILMVAAWIATWTPPAPPPPADLTARMREAVESARQAAEEQETMVPEKVAVRSTRIGLGAGYLTGTATGVGIGALLAWAASAVGRRLGRR